jgi:uncharacterized iron-regulated protein
MDRYAPAPPPRLRRGARALAPLALVSLLAWGVPTPPAIAQVAADCAPALRAARDQRSQLAEEAGRREVLLLGEIHTSASDHAWQLESLETVRRAGVPVRLGLEMVPAARQPLLDRYSAGDLVEVAFLEQVGWAEVWGHDPDLYLPLLRWARQRGVPLLALNAEPEVVRLVRRRGLTAVPPAQREGIGDPAPVGAAYRRRLEAAWRGHGGAANDLERFIDSQRLRDRAMAERLAAARRQDPGRLVVALVGRGHLEDDDGVPGQLRALGVRRPLALLRPELPPACAPAPRGARLGAYLESADGAVWVRRVAAGSAAEAAGLRPGDRIVAVNGEAVVRAGQVIRRVANHPLAEPLRLTIERAGKTRQVRVRLPVSPSPVRASGENGANRAPAAPSA